MTKISVQMNGFKFITILLIATICLLFFNVTNCFAGNEATTFVDTFVQNTDSWWGILQRYAKTIFLLTLTLEVVIFGARMALQQSQLGEIISQFVMTLLFAGFIAAVIMNYQEWATTVAITGLKGVTTELAPAHADAGSPFALASKVFETVVDIVKDAGWRDTVKVLILYIMTLIVVVIFALISAIYILVTCEFYIVANVGIILIGLGGSKMFKDYAINVMRYVLSVAVKLFVLQLIINIGFTILTLDKVSNTGTLADVNYQNMFFLIAQCILLLALAKSLPETVGGIISGSHIGGGNPLMSAAKAVGGAGMKAAGAVAGAGVGAVAAAKVMKAAGSGELAKAAGATGFKARAGLMAKNLMSARGESNMRNNPNSATSILKSRANTARTTRLAKEAAEKAKTPDGNK